MSGNTFTAILRSTITVRQNPEKYCQGHHASIQQNQMVFLKKPKSTQDMGYDTYAANLQDVNAYIRATLTDHVSPLTVTSMNASEIFFSHQALLREHVLGFTPWGPSMTEVVKNKEEGFNAKHTTGAFRRDIVVGYIGRGMLSSWDIYNATTAPTGSQLFLELHWNPISISNAGPFNTMYVPEYRIMAYPAGESPISKQQLPNGYMYSILRWEFGEISHNTNTETRPSRQLTAQLPNMLNQSRTLVEVNFAVSRFSLFRNVDLPFALF